MLYLDAFWSKTTRSDPGINFYSTSDVSTDMSIAQEEIFGPVAAIYKFETEDEVVEIANSTPYGLAGYFFSRVGQ